MARVIIAGTRSFGSGVGRDRICDYIDDVVDESGFDVTEVVSGTARGADQAGELWAEANDIPVEQFPADWDDTSHPAAIVKERKDGSTYNAKAGILRNERMAEYGDRLIAIWDGESAGTRSMISLGEEHLGEEHVHVHQYR